MTDQTIIALVVLPLLITVTALCLASWTVYLIVQRLTTTLRDVTRDLSAATTTTRSITGIQRGA